MPAIVCLLLALKWGGTEYPWASPRIITLFVLSGALIAGFLAVQYRMRDRATVPPRIMGHRVVWASAAFIFCAGAAFLSAVYFLPLWFQAVQGASAVDSGLRNLPLLISFVAVSAFSGALETAFGQHDAPAMLLSTVLTSVGYGLISATFRPDTERAMWIGLQALAGAGHGFGIQQPMMAVQAALDLADVPIGTSAVLFINLVGGAVFVSISQNVFVNKFVEYIAMYAPELDPALVLALGATRFRDVVPPELHGAVTLAYNDALTKVFLVCAAMSAATVFGAVFVPWKSVKAQGKKGATVVAV